MAAPKPVLLAADHPEGGRLWAAVDPAVRFVEGHPAPSRLGAILAPFPTLEAARAALCAAGGVLSESA